MVNALLLALAVTGQGTDYNLIAQEPAPTIKTARGTYNDVKVTALADARAKVRAATQALADAQAEVSALTHDIATEPPPRARIRYRPVEDPMVIRETAPVPYEDVPLIRSTPIIRSVPVIRRATGVRSATYSTSLPATYAAAAPVAAGESCYSSQYSSAAPATYAAAAPVMTESCYSSAYSSSAAPSAYSAPMVSASSVYSTPMISAAPLTYSSAAPIASLGPGVSTYSARTRMGLFGRTRSRVRATSAGFGGASMTFGSGFFGAAAPVCVNGVCY